MQIKYNSFISGSICSLSAGSCISRSSSSATYPRTACAVPTSYRRWPWGCTRSEPDRHKIGSIAWSIWFRNNGRPSSTSNAPHSAPRTCRPSPRRDLKSDCFPSERAPVHTTKVLSVFARAHPPFLCLNSLSMAGFAFIAFFRFRLIVAFGEVESAFILFGFSIFFGIVRFFIF